MLKRQSIKNQLVCLFGVNGKVFMRTQGELGHTYFYCYFMSYHFYIHLYILFFIVHKLYARENIGLHLSRTMFNQNENKHE